MVSTGFIELTNLDPGDAHAIIELGIGSGNGLLPYST